MQRTVEDMDDDALEIRPARADDEALIVPLMETFNHEEAIPWRHGAMIPALRRVLTDASIGLLLLARDRRSGEVAGYGIGTFGFDIEFAGRDAFITELFVAAAHRRRGIGRLLLDALTIELRARGVGAVHLVVRHDNEAARHLYESNGFDAVPRQLMTKVFVDAP